MHVNPEEITALAHAEAVAPRYDIYVLIHKALRAYMVDTLLAVGQLDVDDEAALAQAAQRVTELLAFCRSHLMHENHFIHPAMERHAAGSSQVIAADHVDHERAIDALGAVVQALACCPPSARGRVARALYQQLAEAYEERDKAKQKAKNASFAHERKVKQLAALKDATGGEHA